MIHLAVGFQGNLGTLKSSLCFVNGFSPVHPFLPSGSRCAFRFSFVASRNAEYTLPEGGRLIMELTARANTIKHGQMEYRVIDDVPLLEWAAMTGLTPRQAQIMALEQEIIPHRYIRNFTALNLQDQLKLCQGMVLVCGCGGLGGVACNLLARAGIGFMRLLDGDAFAPSNLNRQWFSEVGQLGRYKAHVVREGILRINPFIEIEAFNIPLDESNGERLLHNMSLCVDALDNLKTRFVLAEMCRRMGISFVHGAVAGWWGQISTFLPESPFSLDNIFAGRRTRDPGEESLGVPGFTASLIGSLQAMETIRILAGKEPCYSGKLLYFDGESGQTTLMPLR